MVSNMKKLPFERIGLGFLLAGVTLIMLTFLAGTTCMALMAMKVIAFAGPPPLAVDSASVRRFMFFILTGLFRVRFCFQLTA
jgi:hypothetical protein